MRCAARKTDEKGLINPREPNQTDMRLTLSIEGDQFEQRGCHRRMTAPIGASDATEKLQDSPNLPAAFKGQNQKVRATARPVLRHALDLARR
jgi:hypothetical protein